MARIREPPTILVLPKLCTATLRLAAAGASLSRSSTRWCSAEAPLYSY